VRAAVLLAGALAVAVLSAGPADAHAYLVRSDPAGGAAVAEPPVRIRLWFSEEISARVASARLVDGSGRTVAGTSTATTGDPRLLELAVPRLGVGTYAVRWQVLAAGDGHTTDGTMVFGVGVVAPGPSAGAAPGPGVLDVALRWARLAALAGLTGALVLAALLPVASIRRRLQWLALASACFGVLAGVAELVVQAQRLAPPSELLLGTRWGWLWLARTAVLLAVLFALRRRAALLFPVGLAVLEALGSHAAAVEPDRAAAVVADAGHILAACLWMGMLPALVLVLRSEGGRAALRAAPLTRLLAVSVGILLVTGLYSAGRQVQDVGDLLGTAYGRALVIKSALLALLLGLGFGNAVRLRHRRPLRGRVVAIEAGIGAAVLLVAGLLAETAPGRPAPPASAHTGSASTGDVVVTVSASSNQPGFTTFTVLVTSTRRPPPSPVDAVRLDLVAGVSRSSVTVQEAAPGRYFGAAQVDAPGPQRLDVIVHRRGEQVTVPLAWQRDPPPAATEGTPLAPLVNGAALALLAAAAAFAGYELRRRVEPPLDQARAGR
jgi:copper transport protein